jgi:hypothetical protein
MMALIDIDKNYNNSKQLEEALTQTQEVLMRVAQYSGPISDFQMGRDHQIQIIDLQCQLTDLQTQQFLALQGDQARYESQMHNL